MRVSGSDFSVRDGSLYASCAKFPPRLLGRWCGSPAKRFIDPAKRFTGVGLRKRSEMLHPLPAGRRGKKQSFSGAESPPIKSMEKPASGPSILPSLRLVQTYRRTTRVLDGRDAQTCRVRASAIATESSVWLRVAAPCAGAPDLQPVTRGVDHIGSASGWE